MNEEDKKHFAEIKERRRSNPWFKAGSVTEADVDWLIAEIELLQKDLHLVAKLKIEHFDRADKAEAELAEIREDCPCVRMQDHFKDTPREAVRFTVSQLINTSVALEKSKADTRRLQEQVQELEEALKKYGRHTDACDIGFEGDPVDCTCGFNIVLAEMQHKEGE